MKPINIKWDKSGLPNQIPQLVRILFALFLDFRALMPYTDLERSSQGRNKFQMILECYKNYFWWKSRKI